MLLTASAPQLACGRARRAAPTHVCRASTYNSPLRPSETAEQAAVRRARESERVAERTKYVTSRAELDAAFALVPEGHLVLLSVESEQECNVGYNPTAADMLNPGLACAALKDSLARVSRECDNVSFISLEGDFDEDARALSRELGVTTFPTLQYWKAGRLLWQHAGASGAEAALGEGVLFFAEGRASDYVTDLTSADTLDAFLKSCAAPATAVRGITLAAPCEQQLAVVDVSMGADSPGCLHVFPAVLALAKNTAGAVRWARLVGDSGPDAKQLMANLKVERVPAFLFFHDGKEVGRYVGADRGALMAAVLEMQAVTGFKLPEPPVRKRPSVAEAKKIAADARARDKAAGRKSGCRVSDVQLTCFDRKALLAIEASNGLPAGPHGDVTSLEMFQFNFPQIRSLAAFPALRSLFVGQQTLARISGLEACPGLESLSLVECGLSSLDGLPILPGLRQLYLYGNGVSNLHLPDLTLLSVLSLANNRLTCLPTAALLRLPSLTDLDVARNRLDLPGACLQAAAARGGLRQLATLKLAGNPAGSLRDLCRLAALPALARLSLQDVRHGAAPASLLAGYAMVVRAALPSLRSLDGEDEDGAETRHREAVQHMAQRRMGFTARAKALRSAAASVRAAAAAATRRLVAEAHHQAAELQRCEGDLHAAVLRGDVAPDSAQPKLCALESARQAAIHAASEAHAELEAATRAADDAVEVHVRGMMVELHTGGNVRFEAAAEGGGGGGEWQSFCALLAAERGARLLHATRVLNRHLGAVHEAAAAAVAGALSTAGAAAASAVAAASPGYGADEDRPFTAGDYGGSVHWSSGAEEEEEEEEEGGEGVLSEGWESESGDDHDEADAHQLVDPTRALTAALRAAGGGASATPVFLFLGRSAATSSDVAEEGFLRALAAQAGVRLHTCPLAAMAEAEAPPGSSAGAGAVPHQLLLVRVCPGVVRLAGGDGAAPCDAVIDAQAMGTDAAVWTCFTPALLLPEYLLHIQHRTDVFKDEVLRRDARFAGVPPALWPALRPLAQMLLPAPPPTSFAIAAAAMAMAPMDVAPPRPLSQPVAPLATHLLTSLSLHSCGLAGSDLLALQLSAACPSLQQLVASRNALTSLDGIQGLAHLRSLCVSDNALMRLQPHALRSLGSLRVLDAARNPLPEVEDVAGLRGLALQELDLSGTGLAQDAAYQGLVLRRLPSLRRLDGSEVTSAAVAAALAASSAVTPRHLAAGARTIAGAAVLCVSDGSVGSIAQLVGQAVALDLERTGLRRLAPLPRLPALRRATLAHNALHDVAEALAGAACAALTDLDVAHNRLATLAGLGDALPGLTALHAGHNPMCQLTRAVLTPLARLTLLSLECCNLRNLTAFATHHDAPPTLPALRELYLGGNLIPDANALVDLASMEHLAVVELAGNPLCDAPGAPYRLRVLHALPRLRVLDGVGVSAQETAEAASACDGVLSEAMLQDALRASNADEAGAPPLTCDLRNRALRSLGWFEAGPHSSVGASLHTVLLDCNPALRSLWPLQALPCLQTLSARGCGLVECGVDDRGGATPTPFFPSLEALDLSSNAVAALAPLQLERMPALRSVALDGNAVLGAALEGVLSGSTPAALINLPLLTHLSLQSCGLTRLPVAFLAGLPSLQSLRLCGNRLKSLVPWLQPHRRLARLTLRGNRLSELSLLLLLGSNCPRLKELVLEGNGLARAPDYRAAVAAACPDLYSLDDLPYIAAPVAEAKAGGARRAAPLPSAPAARQGNLAAPAASPAPAPAPAASASASAPRRAAPSAPMSLLDLAALAPPVSASELSDAAAAAHVPSKEPVHRAAPLPLPVPLAPPAPMPTPRTSAAAATPRASLATARAPASCSPVKKSAAGKATPTSDLSMGMSVTGLGMAAPNKRNEKR